MVIPWSRSGLPAPGSWRRCRTIFRSIGGASCTTIPRCPVLLVTCKRRAVPCSPSSMSAPISAIRPRRCWPCRKQQYWRSITPDGARLFCELADLGYGPLLAYDNFGWLVWSGSVRDERRLEELDAWLSGRESGVYVDLCAFPATDAGLFEHFRASEVRH